MKRLIVICEGPTEKEFCRDVLAPHFQKMDILIMAPTIKHSGGGIVPWRVLKGQVEKHLHERDAVVTTFIDYYGIKDEHGFPGWDIASKAKHNIDKVLFLEQAMLEDLPDGCRHRFIPYLQLHEFESLLFSDVNVFAQNFEANEMDLVKLESIVAEFPNPEDINNSPKTAPSKRIESAVEGYRKVLYGNCLAMDIGLDKMRQRCPHFNEWISNLEKI